MFHFHTFSTAIFESERLAMYIHCICICTNNTCPCESDCMTEHNTYVVLNSLLTLFLPIDTLPDPLVASSAIPSFLAGTFDFGAGFETSYQLDIQNDNIALENNEISFLSLGSPNNGRVIVGGVVDGVEYFSTTRLTITDDECECILCIYAFSLACAVCRGVFIIDTCMCYQHH